MDIVKPELTKIELHDTVCFNCDFYKKSEEREAQGFCHFNPPTSFMAMIAGHVQGHGTPTFISRFPTVNIRAFCSKFKKS